VNRARKSPASYHVIWNPRARKSRPKSPPAYTEVAPAYRVGNAADYVAVVRSALDAEPAESRSASIARLEEKFGDEYDRVFGVPAPTYEHVAPVYRPNWSGGLEWMGAGPDPRRQAEIDAAVREGYRRDAKSHGRDWAARQMRQVVRWYDQCGESALWRLNAVRPLILAAWRTAHP